MRIGSRNPFEKGPDSGSVKPTASAIRSVMPQGESPQARPEVVSAKADGLGAKSSGFGAKASGAGVKPATAGANPAVATKKATTGKSVAQWADGAESDRKRLGEPAIALIEIASIAVGFLVADAVVKKAPIRLLRAQTASPGKFIVLFTGDVASVEEAYKAGIEAAAEVVIDTLFLPGVHELVLPAIDGLTNETTIDSFAAIETFSFAAAIIAADVAVKAAPVGLIEIRPPVGLGGKSFITLTGVLEDLQAAVAAAVAAVQPGGMLCRHILIANPHGDLTSFIM